MTLFDKTIDVLDKSMDLYLLRHQITSDNIANAETPFFKARRVDFEQELQRAVEESDMGLRDIASVTPNIYEDPYSEVGQDLNSVDMDREMAEMTKNDVRYSATTQTISKKFALLKYAIGEGGRE
jgi:flagellar basal-body rod protein FlgB